MWYRPFLDIAWITITVTASTFLAGMEGIILYFHFFEDFPYTLTGLVMADVLLMLAGILGMFYSYRAWYRYVMMIKRVKERVENDSKDSKRS